MGGERERKRIEMGEGGKMSRLPARNIMHTPEAVHLRQSLRT